MRLRLVNVSSLPSRSWGVKVCLRAYVISSQLKSPRLALTRPLLPTDSPQFAPASGIQIDAKRRYSNYPKHLVINMPALSPTMTQGNIGPWKKKVGDRVSAGDVLVDIETDKAQMEFECQEEGYLATILMPEGTKEALVGKPLAIFVDNKEDVGKFKDYKASPLDAATSAAGEAKIAPAGNEPAGEADAAPKDHSPLKSNVESTASGRTPSIRFSHGTDRVFASPLARNTAKAMGVDINSVPGSGPGGRVIKADVMATSQTSSTTFSIPTSAAFIDEPLTNMRKIIAQRLTQSKQSIPHYYLTMEINMDRLLAVREQLNKQGLGKYKVSVNDFLIKAAALSMSHVPAVNSTWQGNAIRRYKHADISVAVATESGLITPIVTRAEGKGLMTISSEMRELATKARENKLKPEQFQGGTFTISNLGMFGIKHFTAVINPPQTCILAVGGTEKRLVSDDEGNPMVSSIMTVTMSCDHRVVDGATGATWLQQFKSYLEEPATMVL